MFTAWQNHLGKLVEMGVSILTLHDTADLGVPRKPLGAATMGGSDAGGECALFGKGACLRAGVGRRRSSRARGWRQPCFGSREDKKKMSIVLEIWMPMGS